VCRFIFRADEAEWALTDHPLINLITVKTLRQGVVSQVTPLINIPKIMQLSKMIDLCTKYTNLLSFYQYSYTNMSSRCPHNMVNFCPLAAEIGLSVWSTPANFNGFHVLAALYTAWQSSWGVSQTAALNRGRHLYSAARPSRWALAHILVCCNFS